MQLRPLHEWNLDYVLSLPTEELDWIDYKSSDWLRPDAECMVKFSKYLSAWANYDGGYLVIGLTNAKGSGGLTVDEGVDCNLKNGVTDWLESKLPGQVEEPLRKISVRAICLPTNSERCIVVVHVPPSDAAPHQASDKKFYTRLGSHLDPLGRRAILDILNRKKHPVVRAEVYLSLVDPDVKDESALVCRVFNESNVFCRHVLVEVSLPFRYKSTNLWFKDEQFHTTEDGKSFWFVKLQNGMNSPLFPHSQRLVRKEMKYGFKIQAKGIEPVSTDWVKIRVYADGSIPTERMEPFEGFVRVRDYREL